MAIFRENTNVVEANQRRIVRDELRQALGATPQMHRMRGVRGNNDVNGYVDADGVYRETFKLGRSGLGEEGLA